MIRQLVTLPLRSDAAGDGRYGAPRGERSHNGIDYECTPGAPVLSVVSGTVSKLGYCYGDDLSWRYVEIRAVDGLKHRLFYVDPLVEIGDTVDSMTPIGRAQDISKRYPDRGMLPHVHYELKDLDGNFINPEAPRLQ